MRNKMMEAFTQETGLRYDETTGSAYGYYNGYHVCRVPNSSNQSLVSLQFSARRGGVLPTKEELKALTKSCREISSCQVNQDSVIVTVKPNGWSWKKTVANAKTALDAATAFLRQNGYADCCQHCGQAEQTNTYLVNGGYMHLCSNCFASARAQSSQQQIQEEQKAENIVGGTVGAFLGSLVGVLVMVILDQLGYVAAISGIVLAVCALKGYEMLGGKLTKKGIVLSALVMVIMVYVGNRITWAIAAAQQLKDYLDMNIFEYFRYLPELLIMAEAKGQYFTSLAMQYLFAAVGAVPSIVSAGKNQKLKNSVRQLGQSE